MKKTTTIAIAIFSIILVNCTTSHKKTQADKEPEHKKVTFTNKGHELIYNLTEKVGNYNKLLAKKDVVYNYTYTTPDGSTDQSLEKYIFKGELSYGKYTKHQRTLNQIKGILEQGYDGKTYWLKANGNLINDTLALQKVAFNRPTNFYWFTMFQKLLDPGLQYEYLGNKTINNTAYEIVKVSFESKNDKPTDIYQLYINTTTGLVDQFLFTVADYGVLETPYLMVLDYETIDGFLIPTKRKYKKSNWQAEVTDSPWIIVHWTDIRFNNGLQKKDFTK